MLNRIGTFVPLCGQHVRGMATLKTISIRLKSVKNIQKITQSMKMVSAAKYARAERELKSTRKFGEGAQVFYEQADVKPIEKEKPSKLIIAVTSDRGLCGAVHSNIVKSIRAELDTSNPDTTKVVCIGDKSRSLIQRKNRQNILFQVNEIGRKQSTFTDVMKITQAIFDSGFEYDEGKIVYNKFRSVVSYRTSNIPIFSVDTVNASEKMPVYDSIDADVMQSYMEYSLASLIYYAIKESACSEQSSRMTSMDSATKNAGEMIEKLTLTFNRTRQAVITRELIEIISGASAI